MQRGALPTWIVAICFILPNGRVGGQVRNEGVGSLPATGERVLPQLRKNVHLTGNITDVIQQGFQLYGIDVIFVPPLQGLATPLKVNMTDADLAATAQVLRAMTKCLFVAVNAHLVLAVQDDLENRKRYATTVTKTIDIPNMQAGNTKEEGEVVGLLSTVFGPSKATLHGSTVTVQAQRGEIDQIEDALTHLFQPEPQVLLEVKTYLFARTRDYNVGVQTPQQITAFNINTEAESLIASNQSVVNSLVASGAVSATDTLGIVEALIASGYGAGSVFNSPFVYYGGGLTATGVQFSSVTANLSRTASGNQQLQDATLHLANDQSGTLKIGQRYPVMTSSTVSLGAAANTATPSIQYEDLGLTLEARPHIEENGGVLLHLHEMFRSLNGVNINGIPVIDNRDFVSDLSVASGQTAVVVSDLSKTEAGSTQGLASSSPTDSAKDQQRFDLVVTLTPIVTRSRQRRE